MESPAITEHGGSRRSERTLPSRAIPILGFIVGLVALLGIVIVALPQLLRGWAESQLTSLLSQKAEIKRLNLNFLTGHIELDSLRVRSHATKNDFVLIDRINADVDLFALVDRKLSLTRLEIMAPVVHLVRSEAAVWNVPAIGKGHASSHSGSGFSVIIHNAVLRNGSLSIEDRSVSPARSERVNGIELTLHDVSPASSDPAKIHGSAMVSDSGTIAIAGDVLPNLRSGNLKVDLTDFSLAPLQGALSNHLGVKGRVTARLAVTWPGQDESSFGVSGNLDGHDIILLSGGRPMGHAANVSASRLEISWPDTVAVGRLLLSKPEFWVRRNESGRFVGFQDEGNSSSTSAPGSMERKRQSDGATTSPQWRIGKITVRAGTVHLEDRSVTPVYSDGLNNLDMTVDDVTSTANQAMTVAARADIASGGALDLQGRASILSPVPSASLKATLHRFVVPSTNSYLKRTVSHYTTDGTLTTVMHIRLSGDRLEVLSDVTLSDLEVEPVPHATRRTVQERIGLPLRLLIALLKDDSGRIVITFPISGPLSNPTFDWTNAIWATIRNAVVKLITLPIRSIGWFVMGGDQVDELPFDPITFDPGSTTISSDMDRKLHDLAKLLRSTNRAVLHITPILSATDLEALRRLPPQSWPIPNLDTAETAGHVLAVRRGYLVAARLAGLAKVPSERLPVTPPKPDPSEAGRPSVKLHLEKSDDVSVMGDASSTSGGTS